MLTQRYDVATGEPYLQEVSSPKRMFRRVVAALAWPFGVVPGCLLVLGEIRTPPNRLTARRKLVVLAEERDMDATALLDLAVRKQALFRFPNLVTPESDPRVVLLDDFNDHQRRNRRAVLRIVSPLGWTSAKGEGLLPYYFGFFNRRLVGEKSIDFGPVCTARDEMARLGPDDMRRTMIELPGVCALCWAVEEMDEQPMPEWGEKRSVGVGPADAIGGY